jgi:hypothetical protein
VKKYYKEKYMVGIKAFPFCCTARILCNFGESITSEGGAIEVDAGSMEKEVQAHIEHYRGSIALLVATTNNQQKTAYKVLKKLGFKSTKWISKNTHGDTKVKMWWKPLGEET